MSKPYVLVRTFRYCQRCERWRSVGNFSVSKSAGSRFVKMPTLGHTCHLCWRKGITPHAGRLPWTVTDKGRALLVAERAAA